VWETGSGTLTIRALTFLNGQTYRGGGAFICNDTIVDFIPCLIQNCRATSSRGETIHVDNSATTINLYGTRFIGNTAESGNGNDIYRYEGTITILNTCPSPYSSNTPTQGKTRMIRRRIVSPILPFIAPKITSFLPIPYRPISPIGAQIDTFAVDGIRSFLCFLHLRCRFSNPTFSLSSSGCEVCEAGKYTPPLVMGSAQYALKVPTAPLKRPRAPTARNKSTPSQLLPQPAPVRKDKNGFSALTTSIKASRASLYFRP